MKPEEERLSVKFTRAQIERLILIVKGLVDSKDLLQALEAAKPRCHWAWRPGILRLSDEPRPQGRCILEVDHEGEHQYPRV